MKVRGVGCLLSVFSCRLFVVGGEWRVESRVTGLDFGFLGLFVSWLLVLFLSVVCFQLSGLDIRILDLGFVCDL